MTVGLIVALRHNPEEPLDAVVQRELGNVLNARPARDKPFRPTQPAVPNENGKPRRRYINGRGYAVAQAIDIPATKTSFLRAGKPPALAQIRCQAPVPAPSV